MANAGYGVEASDLRMAGVIARHRSTSRAASGLLAPPEDHSALSRELTGVEDEANRRGEGGGELSSKVHGRLGTIASAASENPGRGTPSAAGDVARGVTVLGRASLDDIAMRMGMTPGELETSLLRTVDGAGDGQSQPGGMTPGIRPGQVAEAADSLRELPDAGTGQGPPQ